MTFVENIDRLHPDEQFEIYSTMRNAIQAASLRIQQHAEYHNGNDTPDLRATALQVCAKSSVLASADVPVPKEEDRYVLPDTRLAVQLVHKPNLRGIINALMRLIEQHGLRELQRVGVLSLEGGMQGL